MNQPDHAARSDIFEVVNPRGGSSVVLVCEHASPYIPPHFKNLDLAADALRSHVVWDPGAMAVARAMAERLDAVLIAGGVSRLVYDCNRPPAALDAMPARSEVFEVPGNMGLSDAERSARAAIYYTPFHAAVNGQIIPRRDAVLVTLHSFTPVYDGAPRAVQIGVLHDTDARLADAMLACAAHHLPGFDVQRNAPYGPQDGVTHTLQKHGLKNGLLNVMLEIRNDLIATPESQLDMAARLCDWLQAALDANRAGAPS